MHRFFLHKSKYVDAIRLMHHSHIVNNTTAQAAAKVSKKDLKIVMH
ncbi:hypothetical protein [Nostoc sp.]